MAPPYLLYCVEWAACIVQIMISPGRVSTHTRCSEPYASRFQCALRGEQELASRTKHILDYDKNAPSLWRITYVSVRVCMYIQHSDIMMPVLVVCGLVSWRHFNVNVNIYTCAYVSLRILRTNVRWRSPLRMLHARHKGAWCIFSKDGGNVTTANEHRVALLVSATSGSRRWKSISDCINL